MARYAERLRRVRQDADLAAEIVAIEVRGNEGVDDGETQVPILRFMSICCAVLRGRALPQ
jgi:hypothetical protein